MWNKESPEERCEGRGMQLESPHTCGTLITHVFKKPYESPGLKPFWRRAEGAQVRLCMKTILFSVDL